MSYWHSSPFTNSILGSIWQISCTTFLRNTVSWISFSASPLIMHQTITCSLGSSSWNFMKLILNETMKPTTCYAWHMSSIFLSKSFSAQFKRNPNQEWHRTQHRLRPWWYFRSEWNSTSSSSCHNCKTGHVPSAKHHSLEDFSDSL